MRHRVVVVLLIMGLGLIGVLGPISAAEKAEQVKVGFAGVDITPKVDPEGKPVYMAGFGHNRKATGVNDPLFARAVVLKHGEKKIAIVSADLVGLFYGSTERIRKQLPGFASIIVSCTHNHEGPDSMGIWGASALQSGLDRTYLASVERKIVQAVEQADKTAGEVRGRIGKIAVPELIHDSRPPIIKHDELVALQFQNPKGKTKGIVVQWNCHPETLADRNTKISADYVGYTVNYLAKKYQCEVVYLTGTVGGLMTSLRVPIKDEKGKLLDDGTVEKTSRFGELLGQATEKALKKGQTLSLNPFEARSRVIYLPLANKLYLLAKQLGVLERDAYLWNGDVYKAEPSKVFDPKKPAAIKTEISYLRMGDLEIACIPGEIYPELVLGKVPDPAPQGADFPMAPVEPGIYAQLKGPHKMLIGLACDEIGYILPKRQWDETAPFTYGLKKRPYGEINSLGSETGPLLCKAFQELVRHKK